MPVLSTQTPLTMTPGAWNAVMPTITIFLSVLLVLSFTRRRLLIASRKEPDVATLSQEVTQDAHRAMRKRRTQRKKKQTRPNGSSNHATMSMLTCAMGEESALRESTEEETDAEVYGRGDCTDESTDVARDISESEQSSVGETVQAESESIDSDLDRTILSQRSDSEKIETAAMSDASVPVRRLEKICQSSSHPDVGEEACCCGVSCAWGCARHSVYSRNLLLAHSTLNINIVEGPPGLELTPRAAEASSIVVKKAIFAARL